MPGEKLLLSTVDVDEPSRCWRVGGGSLPGWLSEPLTVPLVVPLAPAEPPLVLLPRILSESNFRRLETSLSFQFISTIFSNDIIECVEITLQLGRLSFTEFVQVVVVLSILACFFILG